MKGKWRLTMGIFRLIWKYQPFYYAIAAMEILVTAAMPLVAVWLPKNIMECLTTDRAYTDVLLLIGVYAGLLLGLRMAENFMAYKAELKVLRLKNQLQIEIGKAAMDARLEKIENAAYREEILMAGNISNVTNIIRVVRQMFSCVVTLIGLAYIIVSFNLLFIFLIAMVLSAKVVFTIIRFRTLVWGRKQQAQNDKTGTYLDNIQYFNKGAEKEIRVNSLYKWFYAKVMDFRDRMVQIQFVIMRQYQVFEMINKCIVAVQNFIILIALTQYYKAGMISIAEFTMNFSAIGTLSVTLSKLADQMMEYNQQMLNCKDYNKVVDVAKESGKKDMARGKEKPETSEGIGVEFVNVSFRYPGTQAYILKDVSMRIKPGENVMFVGYNGEGKTTLIKLLCKFYKPDSGKIFLGGQDIWEIPDEEYYGKIATVFQDFALFAFTIRENIQMSDGDGDIAESIRLAGFDGYINSQKAKADTYITKLFDEGGVELSGGEEQKLAISRALQKHVPLVIFDEPTANLDVKTENEVYRTFAEMIKGRTSIMISHRLSMANICDRIFVLDQGRIAESGTHGELMEKMGIYAEMYSKQSEAYQI